MSAQEMPTEKHNQAQQSTVDVLIVGGGPTGVSLGLELAAQGVRFRIVDRALGRSDKSRAVVVQPRTLEVLNRHRLRRSGSNDRHRPRRRRGPARARQHRRRLLDLRARARRRPDPRRGHPAPPHGVSVPAAAQPAGDGGRPRRGARGVRGRGRARRVGRRGPVARPGRARRHCHACEAPREDGERGGGMWL